MMKIEQKRISTFIRILEALVPECRLMITPDGISTLAVDTANVAMVSANLPAASFTEYDEEKSELGMDVSKWKTLLGIMDDPKSTITITRYPTDSRIRFFDGKWDDVHTPLDPTTVRKRPNQPTINLPAVVVVDAKEYAETIRAMGMVGDKVRITIKGNTAELAAEGHTDSIRKEIVAKAGSLVNTAAATSLFSIDYLKETARAMKEAGSITVHAGHDHPIRFDFEIDGIEASFMIAPRIESEG